MKRKLKSEKREEKRLKEKRVFRGGTLGAQKKMMEQNKNYGRRKKNNCFLK